MVKQAIENWGDCLGNLRDLRLNAYDSTLKGYSIHSVVVACTVMKLVLDGFDERVPEETA
jgi:hypothetical protein